MNEALGVARADLATTIGPLRLFATERGLRAIVFVDPRDSAALCSSASCVPEAAFAPSEAGLVLAAARAQLLEYLDGARRQFTVPLDPRGTPFQLAVWDAVAAIPYGETCSYQELARRIGRPGAARAVGAANGANRLPLVVPCHRVVGSSGALTGYAGGLALKRHLLGLERGQHTLAW